jgi:CheY-like chemotaxis protein
MKQSDSDSSKKGGFLSRLFGKKAPAAPEPRPASESASESASNSEIFMSPTAEAPGRRLAKAKSVLIIAADDSVSRRWRRELQEWGYGVEFNDDGPKGLEILFNVAFDALLLDMQTPKIDGVDILRQIRLQEELNTLFVGAFARDKSGETEQENVAIEIGASRVFQRAKVTPDEILTALKTALFPRILQAQPRSKQAAPIPAPAQAAKPAAAPAVSVPPLETAAPTSSRPVISMAPASVAPLNSSPAPINKKVLIIDADENIAGIYRTQIEAAGYEVEVALDGETGFHDLYKINPDVLLLDLLLPGDLSGSEILKKTRAQKKFEKTPILVFTNIYTRDVEEEAKHAGVLRLFNKAAATPRDVVEALNEIFLPSTAVLGGPSSPVSMRFDEKPAPAASIPAPASIPMPSGLPKPAAERNPNDNAFQADIRESLLISVPEFVKTLRGLLQVLLRSQSDPAAQSVQLLELYTRVHSLTANAAIAGFHKVARLSGAVEAMLREFQAKPDGLNASTRRTLTQAMDLLAQLFTGAGAEGVAPPADEQILVVDDEIISRRVIGHSLEKAGLKSTAVSHPDEALKLLQERPFNLVFLDVEMPGMNGFELCKRLRAMPLHAKTPVIFVTALNGFESRAKSSLSGGDDFIGKPFSYIELAVKALIHVLRGPLTDRSGTASAAPPKLAEGLPPAPRPSVSMPRP